MTVRDMERLDRFERKVLRRIFEPRRDEDSPGFRNLRSNDEVMAMYGDISVSTFIRVKRLQWVGHVARMGSERLPRTIMYSRPEGNRPVGRPRLRWHDQVATDAAVVGMGN